MRQSLPKRLIVIFNWMFGPVDFLFTKKLLISSNNRFNIFMHTTSSINEFYVRGEWRQRYSLQLCLYYTIPDPSFKECIADFAFLWYNKGASGDLN